MNNTRLLGWLGGLGLPFLVATATIAAEGDPQSTRSPAEAAQPGQPGAAGQAAPGQPGATGAEGAAGGATTMGQPPGGSENHTQEALKHARAASTSGQKGDYSTISKHAQMAKTHVEAALKEKPGDPHLQAALSSLDTAIMAGNLSEGSKAHKAAKEAISHLEAAGK